MAQRRQDACIAFHLVTIAPLLFVQERFQIAAFVDAGFEIDNPAHAGVDEGAVDDSAHYFPVAYHAVNHPTDSVFRLRLRMRRQDPVSSLAGLRA